HLLSARAIAARRSWLGPGAGDQAAVDAGAALRDDEAGAMTIVGPAILIKAAEDIGLRRRSHEGEAGNCKCRNATQTYVCCPNPSQSLTEPDVSNIGLPRPIRAGRFDRSFTLFVNRQSAGRPCP